MKSSLVLLVALFCAGCTASEKTASDTPQHLKLVFNKAANEYQDMNGKSYPLPVIMDKTLAGSTIELCDQTLASCKTLKAYN